MTERTTVRRLHDLIRRARRKAEPTLPPVSTATGGLRPGIDLSDTAAMQELDDQDDVRRLK